ncbi:inorganic phosphate transporter [Kineosporia sp. J2-2]|uniref:Phosphate transporter n=1 Tax=Kineosporia corallincola TaxID=2835133 RepID=A0ABS5TF33_9ACTN|nr:inorganic phosphate transporter [Kineosporia corallincola]MBT0769667.1 inorganic phosphate transporter [Kineosporia corallincola]
MTTATVILVLVVVVALAFDFTNGFHDTANAMAASIATGALTPKVAVALSGILNLIGAFLSVEVALTVTNAVVKIQTSDGSPKPELLSGGGSDLLIIVLAGLIGGITWNLLTWLVGLPSSSSHALFGGLVGATMAGLGTSGVNWNGDGSKIDGVVGKVILPAIMSPMIAGIVAAVGTWLVYRVTRGVAQRYSEKTFRWGQIGSASLVSLAHGTNDAQKTMGIITLALIASGHWTDTENIPFWVKAVCAIAIALGSYLGGWRIIRTLGKGLVDIASPQGMASDASSGAVILISSHMGLALSTTHVATGSILGSGVGKPDGRVRWRVAGRMVAAWLITLPAAGLIGALMWGIAHMLGGGMLGALVIALILALATTAMWLHSRNQPVHAGNVTDEWEPSGDVATDVVDTNAATPQTSAPAA